MRDGLLHLADLHLGASVSSNLREADPALADRLERSRDRVLARVAEWVADPSSRVGVVVIVGDLFHRHDPPTNLAEAARQAAARMRAVVPVVTVPGNHDEYSYSSCVYRQGWPERLVANAEPAIVWQGELEDGTRLSVTAAAYEAGKTPPGGLVRLPEVAAGTVGVALVHGTVEDYFSAAVVEGERCFRVSHRQAAEAGYAYLGLGHLHGRRHWTAGRCLAAYPGPPVGPSLSDPGAGSFLLVELAGGGVRLRSVDEAELLGPRWHVVDATSAPGEKPADVARRVAAGLPKDEHLFAGLRLSGQGDRDNFAAEVQRELLALGHRAVVEERALVMAPPPDLATLQAEESLTGEYVRAWRQWREAEGPPEAHALSVLHEGLAALRRGR